LYTKLFKWVFKKYDKILLVSQKSGKELSKIGLPKNKMELFYHWLDQSIFRSHDKNKSKKLLNLPINVPIVLFVGRIIEMKGVFELLQAAKKLPNILFLCIGDGPDILALSELSKKVNNFKVLGKIHHIDTVKYYNSADVFVLPSLSDEAQPMTIMEALSCGCPVIATNKGSAGKMFDNTCGMVINPTSADIVSSIQKTLNHPNFKNISLLAKKYALTHYSPSNADIIIRNYYAKH